MLGDEHPSDRPSLLSLHCTATSHHVRAGIKIESETLGEGREATRGDTVTLSYELFLSRGDKVQAMDAYSFTLGKREVIAALDYGVEGMRVGGRRRFRAGPHLGYRDQGVPGRIPPNAVLIFDVTLHSVTRRKD